MFGLFSRRRKTGENVFYASELGLTSLFPRTTNIYLSLTGTSITLITITKFSVTALIQGLVLFEHISLRITLSSGSMAVISLVLKSHLSLGKKLQRLIVRRGLSVQLNRPLCLKNHTFAITLGRLLWTPLLSLLLLMTRCD